MITEMMMMTCKDS